MSPFTLRRLVSFSSCAIAAFACCGEPASERAHAAEKPAESAAVKTPSSEKTTPSKPTETAGKPAKIEEVIAAIKKAGGQVFFDKKRTDQTPISAVMKNLTVTDDAAAYLASLPTLESLNIVYPSTLTDAGLAHLAGLTKLKRLTLEGTKISDAGLVHLKNMKDLNWLNLTNTKVVGPGLVHLKELPKLTHLVLGFTEIDDDQILQFADWKQLRLLGLDDTRVTGSAVEKLRKALPKCEVQWSGAGVAAIDASKTPAIDLESQTPSASSSASAPGDWPQWRGPNRDGISQETGLLQEWPESGPPLKWETRGIGNGYSTIVIQNGKVFATGTRNGRMFATALDAANGKQIWQVETANDRRNRTTSTPTADGEFLYALSWEGELACLQTSDGAIVWHCNFAKDFGGDYMSHGAGGAFSESVLIDGDRLICTPGAKDAAVAALDKRTGKVVWKATYPANVGKQGTDEAGFSSAMVSEACGIRQYVQNSGRGLISVAADDGRTLWTYNRIACTHANIPTPIIVGDFVFASTAQTGGPDSGTALLKVVPDGAGLKVEEIYRLPERIVANHHGGMVLIGDYVYMGHGYSKGFPLCLEMKSGKVAWKPGRGPGSGSAAIVYADGHLYYRYENGVIALIEANPEKYRLKGKFSVPEDKDFGWSHPVVAGGCLYIRGMDVLHCYDVHQTP